MSKNKIIYIDCTGGISGDMLTEALSRLAEQVCGKRPGKPILQHSEYHKHNGHDEHHENHEHHGRSFEEVKNLIVKSTGVGANAKAFAIGIYDAIAAAEAKVHERTLETVHFHEVGRDEAIVNALGTGAALEAMGFSAGGDENGEAILVSPIYDGNGFVECAHGRIPVPVPAVRAMMDKCQFTFRTAAEVNTEMVTPSGLAALMGIGAVPAGEDDDYREEAAYKAEATGTRTTGRGGLKVYYIKRGEQ